MVNANHEKIKYLDAVISLRYLDEDVVFIKGDNKLPCCVNNVWYPLIDLNKGRVCNWEEGIEVNIYAKIRDEGIYTFTDEDMNTIYKYHGYVPDCLAVDEPGYGDYVILIIDINGYIKNWKKDLDDIYLR